MTGYLPSITHCGGKANRSAFVIAENFPYRRALPPRSFDGCVFVVSRCLRSKFLRTVKLTVSSYMDIFACFKRKEYVQRHFRVA
jgi:hypothetical protein